MFPQGRHQSSYAWMRQLLFPDDRAVEERLDIEEQQEILEIQNAKKVPLICTLLGRKDRQWGQRGAKGRCIFRFKTQLIHKTTKKRLVDDLVVTFMFAEQKPEDETAVPPPNTVLDIFGEPSPIQSVRGIPRNEHVNKNYQFAPKGGGGGFNFELGHIASAIDTTFSRNWIYECLRSKDRELPIVMVHWHPDDEDTRPPQVDPLFTGVTLEHRLPTEDEPAPIWVGFKMTMTKSGFCNSWKRFILRFSEDGHNEFKDYVFKEVKPIPPHLTSKDLDEALRGLEKEIQERMERDNK